MFGVISKNILETENYFYLKSQKLRCPETAYTKDNIV